MRSLVVILAAQLAVTPLWAQPVSAPDSQPVLLELPVGKPIQTPQGRLQGFNLDEFKLILRIHTDYRAWGRQVPLLMLQVKTLEDQIINYKLQINLLQEQKAALELELPRLTKKWSDENLKRLQCEAKPAFGPWVAWGVAALATVTAAVLAGVLLSR
jgi:hypothetical protein